MKGILFILLILSNPGGINRISKANKAKETAERAYKGKDYKAALKEYKYLTDSLKLNEEEILLNKAHCYYNLKENTSAQQAYSNLSAASNKSINSIANQQLGLIAFQDKNLEKALNYFKASLKAYPENEEARYDYELVKKLLKDQQKNNKDNKKEDKQDQQKQDKQKQDQQKQDQQKQDQQKQNQQQDKQDQNKDKSQEQDKKDKEDKKGGKEAGEKDQKKGDEEEKKKEDLEKKKEQDANKKKEEKGKEEKKKEQEKGQGEKDEKELEKLKQQDIARKLKELNLNEDKARMILEAMRSNEVQYLQQKKRVPKYAPDKSKPDW